MYVRCYAVNWDNGHARDQFPMRFTSRRKAESFAREWKRGMIESDDNPKEARRSYSWEVVEVAQVEVLQ